MLLAIQQISEKVCQKRHIRVDIGLYIAIVGSYKGVAEIPRMPFKQILPAAICLKNYPALPIYIKVFFTFIVK